MFGRIRLRPRSPVECAENEKCDLISWISDICLFKNLDHSPYTVEVFMLSAHIANMKNFSKKVYVINLLGRSLQVRLILIGFHFLNDNHIKSKSRLPQSSVELKILDLLIYF